MYDREGVCYDRNYYLYTPPDTWQLSSRHTDFKWFEFHGFDNGDVLFFSQKLGLYDGYSPKNKNKISHHKGLWNLCGTDIWKVDNSTEIEWENFPFSYYYEWYKHDPERICIAHRRCLNLNENYHITTYTYLDYEYWNCDTIAYQYIKDDYINKYDERGRRYEYSWINTGFHDDMDSVHYLKMTYTVDSFTYVLRPVDIPELSTDNHTLQIIPNPSGETVRITAADDMATVSFYASDGRLAYSRDGAGKEMIVNIQGLAKGVYVVQARLKNGGVQTGKLIITE